MTTPRTRGRVPPDYTANVRAEIGRVPHLTHRRTAELIGMSWSTWLRRMSGETAWAAADLDRLAYALGIPLDRLTGRDR